MYFRGTELKHGKITQNMKDNSNKGKKYYIKLKINKILIIFKNNCTINSVEKENIIGKKISTMKENFWMIN